MRSQVLLISFLLLSNVFFAQTKKEATIVAKVEMLKKAMIDADSSALDKLSAMQLSYGHSSGVVENKTEFISKIITGKSNFVSIDLSNQSLVVTGNTAIVRHKLDAVTNNDGKPGEVHLFVLLVWQKQNGDWKLLARQAVKQQ